MQWLMPRLRLLACGAVTLGILQAIQSVNLNQIWAQFLAEFWSTLLGLIVALLVGGDPSEFLSA